MDQGTDEDEGRRMCRTYGAILRVSDGMKMVVMSENVDMGNNYPVWGILIEWVGI